MTLSEQDLLDLSSPSGGRWHARTANEARDFCRRLALGHYENFPVGSLIVPRSEQRHFYSVYAFARVADDIADELPKNRAEEKRAALDSMENFLRQCEANNQAKSQMGNPIFWALAETMREKDIPPDPLARLLTAFRQDSDFRQAETFADLERYCSFSANPVGELVLRIFHCFDARRAPFSDAICTALQLANFWQDFSRDLARGRVFIPREELHRFRLDADELFAVACEQETNKREKSLKLVKERFLRCFDVLFQQTKSYFTRGKNLLPLIPHARLRAELALTIAGGESVLKATARAKERLLVERPHLSLRNAPSLAAQATRLFAASYFRANDKLR
jgi:squalene synthase HpnC